MPSDSNGVYSLPSGYVGTTGEPIEVSQHNPPLEDLAAAQTARLMRSGAAPMTGPLKLADGSAVAPSLTFNTATGIGFYKNTAGKMVPVGMLGVTPVGGVIDFAGATAPSGWLLCYGQSLLRADYPDLFTAIGTAHGAADGTHFSLPDCRGRVTAGKDDMGGTSAFRLTVISGSLGGAGGAQQVTLSQSNLPSANFTHSGTTLTNNAPSGINTSNLGGLTVKTGALGGGTDVFVSIGGSGGTPTLTQNTQNTVVNAQGSAASGGSGTAFDIVQPTIVFNKIIFAGV